MLRILILLLTLVGSHALEPLQDEVLAAARAANDVYQRKLQALYRASVGEDRDQRVAALLELGRTRDPQVIPAIMPLLDPDVHDEPTVRAAAYALVNLGAVEATEQLRKVAAREYLEDPEAQAVRVVALNALHQLAQNHAVDYKRESATEDRETRAMGVTDLGTIKADDAGDILAAALRTDTNHIRRMAAIGLGRLGNDQYAPDLMEALTDPDAMVRRYAAEGLVLLNHKRAVPHLLMAAEANLAGGDIRRALLHLTGEDFGYNPRANIIDRQIAVERGFVWWTAFEQELR